MKRVSVITHPRAPVTSSHLQQVIAVARESGVLLRFDSAETRKHGLVPGPGLELDATWSPHDEDLCAVLGGDGTILNALRTYSDTGVPVFAINFGLVGFLATIIEPDAMARDLEAAFRGEFDIFELPSISVGRPQGSWTAFNDVSVHRKPGSPVARLAYAMAGEEVGSVRCDGLVVATPQGSTGYNLANGGPVLAWGVEGFVVSFIAPHSLTARALVVAPNDHMTINNASRSGDPVDVHVDGQPAFELPAGEDAHVEFARSHSLLAQLPGATFYHRLRERFGRLAI